MTNWRPFELFLLLSNSFSTVRKITPQAINIPFSKGKSAPYNQTDNVSQKRPNEQDPVESFCAVFAKNNAPVVCVFKSCGRRKFTSLQRKVMMHFCARHSDH